MIGANRPYHIRSQPSQLKRLGDLLNLQPLFRAEAAEVPVQSARHTQEQEYQR